MSDDDTATVRETLMAMHARDGGLTPLSVLAEARDPGSPLHSHFEWDDTTAAERYRLSQAGALIIRCRIWVQVEPDRHIRARAFSHDSTDRLYKPTAVVLTGAGRDALLDRALRDLEAVRRKYEGLVEWDQVLRAAGEETAA